MLRRLLLLSACFASFAVAQYPITFGMMSKILPNADMAKTRTFLTSLNADKTLDDKKRRVNSWIPANFGSALIPNLQPYAKSDKAVKAALALLDHRNTVASFWTDLMPLLQKTFDATTATQYKQMWLRVDKTFDNEFFDVLNEWYAYCHYRSANNKRTALYNNIQTVSNKYANNSKLNWKVQGDDYWTPIYMSMLFGSW
ncbi:unnamed protein product [Caenorhabditis auriculariae]|uniref:SXP/RAL-2 family protein Ani s 5-like cation-binding domain-containing protein n=1 Tax=Caenorhabditis auriculariae TaxID=2777116 RepID=A0A8S1H6Q3_9PELO|nr:unnamed protein product [Caenorhabditis auriculariae]